MLILYLSLLLIPVVFPKTAHAYLDPSTGSYFLQLAIGVLMGGAYLLKVYWGKIKAFIGRVIKKLKSKEKRET